MEESDGRKSPDGDELAAALVLFIGAGLVRISPIDLRTAGF